MGRRVYTFSIILSIILFSATIFAASDTFAVFPGNNGKIAFENGTGSDFDIYVMNQDGTGKTQITSNVGGVSGRPDVSPDGLSIAYSHPTTPGNSATVEIFTVVISTMVSTQLSTSDGVHDINPSWNGAGTKLIFDKGFGGASDMRIFDVGTGLADVTLDTAIGLANSGSTDGSADWCSTTNEIVFSSNRDGDNEVYYYDLDVGITSLVNLTANTFVDGSPNWSDDCSKIVFNSNRVGGVHQIYVMDANGANQNPVTSDAAASRFGTFSPDGDKIAFQSKRAGDAKTNVYRVDYDGNVTPAVELNTANVSQDGIGDSRFPDWGSVTDATAPTGAITHSDPNANERVMDGNMVTFTAEFTKAMDQLSGIKLQISAPGMTTAVIDLTPTPAGDPDTWTGSHTFSTGGDGAVSYSFTTGEDIFGNALQAAPTSSQALTLDNTPPTFEIEYFEEAALTTSLGDNPKLNPYN